MEEEEEEEKKLETEGGREKLGRKWRRRRMSDNILGPEVRIEKGKEKGWAVILPPLPPTLHSAPNPIHVRLKFDPTYAPILAFLLAMHSF
jgi:hypothetical protein